MKKIIKIIKKKIVKKKKVVKCFADLNIEELMALQNKLYKHFSKKLSKVDMKKLNTLLDCEYQLTLEE